MHVVCMRVGIFTYMMDMDMDMDMDMAEGHWAGVGEEAGFRGLPRARGRGRLGSGWVPAIEVHGEGVSRGA